jgi:hypothetical protein
VPDLTDLVNFPHASPTSAEIAGALEASTNYTSVISGAANTKGSWTQVIASSAKDICGLLLGSEYVGDVCAIDIGIGGAGSETVLVPNVLFPETAGGRTDQSVFIPIFIVAGTRVALRTQTPGGGLAAPLAAILLQQPRDPNIFPPRGFPTLSFGAAENAGFVSGSTTGTTLTAAGSAHTKGSWTQLLASTARRCGWLLVSILNANMVDCRYLIDVGIGGAGSEAVLIPDLLAGYSSTNWTVLFSFPVMIPPGSRIAARCQASTANKTIQVSLVLLEVL